MAPQEHRAIPERNPPYMLTGLVVGFTIAIAGVAVHHRRAPPIDVVTSAAPAIVVAPVAAPVVAPLDALPPLPPFPGRVTGHTNGPTLHAEEGESDRDFAATVAYYESAFGDCASTLTAPYLAVVRCARGSEELDAVVEDRRDHADVVAQSLTLRAQPLMKKQSADWTLCSSALPYIKLPTDAVAIGGSSTSGAGRCAMSVPRPPDDVVRDFEERVARGAPWQRQTRVGGVEAWALSRAGIAWQIIALDTPGGTSVDVMGFDPGGGNVPILVGHAENVRRLERECAYTPCAQRLLDDQPAPGDVHGTVSWDLRAEGCLWSCASEPHAPSRVAPFDAIVPNSAR